MKVEHLKGYGVAASDAEADWSEEIKKKLLQRGKQVVLSNLSSFQKVQFAFYFANEKRRAKRVDLTSIRARGMNNDTFLAQQIEYLSFYLALRRVVGAAQAQTIMFRVMDATAREALLASLPTPEDVRSAGAPFDVFRKFLEVAPQAAERAGCHEMVISENTDEAFQFDIRWCVWLELAKLFGAPEACIPNCYADDLAYPDYFASLGINYCRRGTLAQGAKCCDFRFERRLK
ncbi:MAG: L-2-amino-thiazoline-4-carboxylic acid hydrolase [Candidatus Hydrogenedentes bacterium]|nr:L-2-amino-thiazoline-4-carboxylic acid hydrolase [Candidatus Hydrogenedentota bacterium]